ncbi:putative zingipain [Helianthus annuus]|nr:putative zingipain [Helianthus annuus]
MDCLKAEDEDKLGGPPRRVFEYVITNGGIASEMDYPFTGVFGACDQEKKKIKAATSDSFCKVPESEEMLKIVVKNQLVTSTLCG